MSTGKSIESEDKLPFCTFPTAADKVLHGVQPLPEILNKVTAFTIPNNISNAARLSRNQLNEMTQVIANAFATKEPIAKHVFNKSDKYTKQDYFETFISTFLLHKEDVLQQSLVILQNESVVVGVSLNEIFSLDDEVHDKDKEHNGNNAHDNNELLTETFRFFEPIIKFLKIQDVEAVEYMNVKVDGFQTALNSGKVGHIFLVARSEAISANEMFQVITSSIAHYQSLGFAFIIVEATNNWTGAACEKVGAYRVHFSPFRAEIQPGISEDGYLSAKDSGSMLYLIVL